MNIWFFSLISVFLVSLISLIGIFTLFFKKYFLQQIILLLVSLATGGLFGGVFFHLIPESYETIGSTKSAYIILSGIILFFILEKFIRWHHCHRLTCMNKKKHLASINIIGDSLHNLTDGLIIGASYMTSIPLGITATIAVVLHEIPQELGDFGVLIYSGYSKKKALLFNFLVSLTAVFGTVVALIMGQYYENLTRFLIPLTAGGFIYIAGSDLLPELHAEMKFKDSLLQFLMFIVGLTLMALLLFWEN